MKCLESILVIRISDRYVKEYMQGNSICHKQSGTGRADRGEYVRQRSVDTPEYRVGI